MKKGRLVNWLQRLNLLTLVIQLVAKAAGVETPVDPPAWVPVLQGIAGVLAPSVDGIGHRVVFGTDQQTGKPADQS